jgi:HEAT repeat protein
MRPEQLLQEFEQLRYQDRMYRMVEIGRHVTSDERARETITVFARGGLYQRWFALQSCYGSRDAQQALQALSDPSRSVRGLALNLVALLARDDELLEVLERLPLAMRKILICHLHGQRRYALIDSYLDRLAERQSDDLHRLLSFGSHDTVLRHLKQVSQRLGLPYWCRLVRRHPQVVVEQLQAQAAATDFLDQRLILLVNTVLPILTRIQPDLALELVRTMVALVPLAQLDVQILAQRRPDEIMDLMVQSGEQSRIRFQAATLHKLENERLLTLFTRYPDTVSTSSFPRLKPAQRLMLYQTCARGWRDSEGVLSYDSVSALPTAQREQEARRHLALPTLMTSPLQRLRYAAFLPWDEALTLLDNTLRSPDADLRAVSLSALITAVRYQSAHLADALRLVVQRRYEQDPVRRAMLAALAALPYGRWSSEQLADLTQIMQDAFNATDLSSVTAQSIELLVVRLLPFHPEWSASQLALVYKNRGRVGLNHLDRYITDTAIRRIVPALLPVLTLWQAREHEIQLVGLAHALGKRLRFFPELVDLLVPLLYQTRSSWVGDSILSLLYAHWPERLTTVVPTMLERDKSSIVLQTVAAYLHRHRQDLITPFLGQNAFAGRFSSDLTRLVLPLDSGFFRWTPTQQEMYAHTLLEVANSDHRPIQQLLSTIRRLAVMPSINPDHLVLLASDERDLVRDAALRALGRLDAGQGIPTLLEALSDHRARVAIYALRGALLAMPQYEALKLLRGVSMARVTVAKEVVRLIGDVASEEAYRELQELERQEDLHRDVRVALLRAFWPYAERSETWEIFMRAALSPDAAIARGVAHIPADGLSPQASKRLAVLTATLLTHPEPAVRIDALTWCKQHPRTDREHVLLPSLLRAMKSNSSTECRKAADAVYALSMQNDASLLGDAVRDLLSNRRALDIAIGTYVATLRMNHRRLLAMTRRMLAALEEDPLTISLRLKLILSGLPWEEVASELIRLVDQLHADVLVQTEGLIEQAISRPDADLLDLEMALWTQSDERLRRLALAALIAQSRQAQGWSDACIERLQTYRDDPSPLVAEKAQFTFVVA